MNEKQEALKQIRLVRIEWAQKELTKNQETLERRPKDLKKISDDLAKIESKYPAEIPMDLWEKEDRDEYGKLQSHRESIGLFRSVDSVNVFNSKNNLSTAVALAYRAPEDLTVVIFIEGKIKEMDLQLNDAYNKRNLDEIRRIQAKRDELAQRRLSLLQAVGDRLGLLPKLIGDVVNAVGTEALKTHVQSLLKVYQQPRVITEKEAPGAAAI